LKTTEKFLGENEMVYKLDEVPKEQTRLSLWDGCQSTLSYWNLTEDPENKTTIN
jgi:hypothetical protein